VARKHGVTISNIFHAGDGNMHPIILFNPRVPGDLEKARAAGEEILEYCIAAGGTITGEHGVGMEKNELMAKLFSPDTLETMRRLKVLFDPDNRLNPGKMLPTGRGCAEIRSRRSPIRAAAYRSTKKRGAEPLSERFDRALRVHQGDAQFSSFANTVSL